MAHSAFLMTVTGMRHSPWPNVLGGACALKGRAQVTSREVSWSHLAHRRGFNAAALFRIGAARMEVATGRRAHRAWHFSGKHVGGTLPLRVRDRHGIEQRFRVGMLGLRE